MELRVSQIESDRFGIRIGRADSLTDPNELAELREFITQHKLQCVIARCSSKAVSLIHALEAEGFQLMEGRIRYIFSDLTTAPDFTTKLPDNAVVRMFSANDNLEPIVRSSYAGYKGHYHHNPLFKTTDCDDTYVDWALRSAAETSPNNYCAVIEKSGKLLGFATGAVAAEIMLDRFAGAFELALVVSAPIMATVLLTQFILGLLTKFVPQLNVFIVSMPLSLLVGLYVVTYSLPELSAQIQNAFDHSESLLGALMQGSVK